METTSIEKNKEIVKDFIEKKNHYDNLGESMHSLLKTLIAREGIAIHSIQFRVKDIESLKSKIERKGKYKSLNDITDVLGLRIVTYYSKDVDLVESVVRREFIVDDENTIDKRKTYEPDRFGYMSLHYIISLNNTRSNLVEYNLFSGIKFEVQIRTILQHTWAEIEHDLGYKSKTSVPEHIRRKFSILSSCLELVDSQFVEISDNLKLYDEQTKKEVSLKENNEKIGIDAISLKNYVLGSSEIQELYDKYISYVEFETNKRRDTFREILIENKTDDKNADYSKLALFLNMAKIFDLQQLRDVINSFSEDEKLIPSIFAINKEHDENQETPSIYIKYFFFLFIIYIYFSKSGKEDVLHPYELAYKAMCKIKNIYDSIEIA
ncbi:hypothetical protein H2Y57_14375 [Pectobacterium aroidearum]|uniref:RelA/SpoT domain-containing protein n=1 Tax=Pectobacterium aroidearum TaxID=1201031 RepID=A0AAW3SUY0_9GAMM|nr:hypothetical protein [Pectobacterium aroidearum]MBA5204866.1 hypothetical protein [Pectobacterium aroidearum]